MLNYRCLVLDHDDTVVRSEETVNYPSFLEALKVLRPGRTITREEFTRWCFSPGFSALCSDYIGLTPEEIDVQYDMWRSYVATHIPPPYDGLRPILTRWKQEGGLLCVSSHSARENILRDYRLHFGLEPDQIFDWDLGEDRRKPSPYALQEIMRLYDLRPDELLMRRSDLTGRGWIAGSLWRKRDRDIRVFFSIVILAEFPTKCKSFPMDFCLDLRTNV